MPQSPNPSPGDSAARLARAALAFGLTANDFAAATLVSGSGFSAARLWKIASARGPLCLREWPPEHPTFERLRFIHAVQRAAFDRGVQAVPRPLATSTGETIWRDPASGRLWELTPWMPGEAHLSGPISTPRLHSALAALSAFHAAVADVREDGSARATPDSPLAFPASASFTSLAPAASLAPSPGLAQRLTLGDELERSGVARYRELLRGRPGLPCHALAERACSLFPEAWRVVRPQLVAAGLIRTRLVPCLRDCHREHVLFTGDEATGLVDFGALRLESPLAAVARLLGSYAEDDETAWRRGVTAFDWLRAPDALSLLRAFDRSAAVLACFTWLNWIYEEGRAFDEPERVAARLQRLIGRLERVAHADDFWMRIGAIA
ncbi:MAG TPA: aminoglycoside phosphotransferase family protein [Pirellulales bacterium]